MDYSEYSTQLIKTIIAECAELIFFLPFVLMHIFSGEKTSKNIRTARTAKKKNALKKVEEETLAGDLGVLAYFILIIVYAINVLPIVQDIMGNCYDCMHGEYQIETAPSNASGSTPTKWVIMTTDDGEEVRLNFSKGIDMDDFPENGTYGTAVYAENSKYLLEFIPDEPLDNK